MVTHQRIRELLNYDPDTGHFTWAVGRRGASKGARAGGYSKFNYRCLRVDDVLYAEHRLVYFWMTGTWPEYEIDHINGVPDDNRWCNLRPATSSQQQMNSGLRVNNVSGVRGVFKVGHRWRAVIWKDKTPTHLGYYDTKEEAAKVYEEASDKLFGDYKRRTA